jgi:hydroxyacylglutathione hydrolase
MESVAMQTGQTQWVTPDIRRIVAPNPSPMTGPGTNTYLIGSGPEVIVVDPGPMLASHLAAVRTAIGPNDRVTAIVVTHAHRDHSEAAPLLSDQLGAPALAFGTATSGRSAVMQRLLDDDLAEVARLGGGEGVDAGFAPDRCVADSDVLAVGSLALRVLHTPGHMGGHICLGLGDVLLSADCAMGWASSLISPPDGDMGDYIASLTRLAGHDWRLMLPGHGAEVAEVKPRLRALREHRHLREAQILTALAQGAATVKQLTAAIYHDTPAHLRPAAQRIVLAHLIDLWAKNSVGCDGSPGFSTIFHSFHKG